jgi:hypothetical protein
MFFLFSGGTAGQHFPTLIFMEDVLKAPIENIERTVDFVNLATGQTI